MDRIILIIIVLLAAGMMSSQIISRLFNKKWVRYLPSVIGVVIIAYITVKISSEQMDGFVELGYNIRSLMVLTFIAGNLGANFLLKGKNPIIQ